MRRAAFLALTGLSADAHRAMIRRDVLPYIEEAEGWADYSPAHVFATVLALKLGELVPGQGEAARRVVDFPADAMKRLCSAVLVEEPDTWGASYLLPASQGARGVPQRLWAVGRLSEVLAARAADGRPVTDHDDLDAIALVNLSALARTIQARADAAGLVL